jgi:uncharacterized protein (DUF2235 family)
MERAGVIDANRKPKTFVLCFDGTGNKFSGTDADSNILKIYRMLDRDQGDQFHYYQPGIGTYVTSSNLEHTSVSTRLASWYAKAKDSAVGTSFADHVMGGYKFLMRYYTPGDDIYLFGFSRGAYTARFLSEMMDWVGLLSAGNEELARFAWKTFSKWQSRRGGDEPEDKQSEKELYDFMTNFRETFSRPVKRIRFLGLFDTVNSVPRFENAWMQRSKFPYSVRSSAKIIRHAVAINERRANFRQDLISATKLSKAEHHRHFWRHHDSSNDQTHVRGEPKTQAPNDVFRTPPMQPQHAETQVPDIRVDAASPGPQSPTRDPLESRGSQNSRLSLAQPIMTPSMEELRGRTFSTAGPIDTRSLEEIRDHSQVSQRSQLASKLRNQSSRSKMQDIEEVWFPGCHADIGGGWPKRDGEAWPLSHAPLVWMVHEAEKAGLKFNPYKMSKLGCCQDAVDEYGEADHDRREHFHRAIHESGCRGFIHDCLEHGGGLPRMSVISWKIMEYLPFRRMDLRPDGSWKPIRWPLPCGETRDIPEDAKIHRSAIKRMEEDKNYRPGNLIIGGGGRGVKQAPEGFGIGYWRVYSNEGDHVRETYVRKYPINGKAE